MLLIAISGFLSVSACTTNKSGLRADDLSNSTISAKDTTDGYSSTSAASGQDAPTTGVGALNGDRIDINDISTVTEPIKVSAGLDNEDCDRSETGSCNSSGDELSATDNLSDIHFDYDSYHIRQVDRPMLDNLADLLTTEPKSFLTVEGYCDERGTYEYNLALGSRRANAVKDYLSAVGVGRSRVFTISYGKERPLDPGHSEEAWVKNRRAHFEFDDKAGLIQSSGDTMEIAPVSNAKNIDINPGI
ncbi:MAG: OmpA family protein [Nitrospirae bacterium]|nr:OmpA family protein [Nitrospirota bacterium]